MSKEETSLEDLDPIFKQAYIQKDKEEAAAKKSDAKGDDKKSLVETAKQELNIPEADRYLLDLLGAYGGKKTAQMLDAGVRRMPEPSASTMRGAGFSTAGLGPANAPRTPPMSFGAPPAAPTSGMPSPVAGGPAGPVGGPASSGAKWLQNWGGISKEGFSGGVPEGAAQYNKMKPQGQIMQGMAKKGLITPQPVQPGVFTGGQLSISGQRPAAPPSPPPPSPLSQAAGVLKQGARAVLNAPGVSGALGGLGMAESGQEFMRRQAAGDVPGQVMAGMGVAGGALAMVPNPMAKALGAALATASPLSLYLSDKIRAPSNAPELTDQERAFASRPAFGMYPQMPRPQLRPRTFAPGENMPPVESYR